MTSQSEINHPRDLDTKEIKAFGVFFNAIFFFCIHPLIVKDFHTSFGSPVMSWHIK